MSRPATDAEVALRLVHLATYNRGLVVRLYATRQSKINGPLWFDVRDGNGLAMLGGILRQPFDESLRALATRIIGR